MTPQRGLTPPAEATATAILEPSVALNEIKRQWPQVLQAVQQRKMSTVAYLLEAQPVTLSAGRLTIGFPPAFRFHQEALDRPEHRALIEEALRQVTGWTGRLEIVVVEGLTRSETAPTLAEEPPSDDAPMPDAPGQPAFMSDTPPIVRAAAELFGGRPRSAATPPRR